MPDEKREGRPSLYRPEFVEELIEYFSVKPYTRNDMGKLVASDFPSLAGFAVKIGVHRDTLLEWSKVHPEFSGAYKRAKDFQENFLVVNGNRGLIDTAFGIFTAKNVLGWRDKQPGEVDVVVNNVSNMTDDQIEARAQDLIAKTQKSE